jgi:hypothetical protein
MVFARRSEETKLTVENRLKRARTEFDLWLAGLMNQAQIL